MPKAKPNAAQAQLHLQLYDLRREAKLREARDWFLQKYFAESLEESGRLTPPGSQENAYMRMVVSYWEQACALLNYGLLHEDLFFETSGEFYAVWDRIKPIISDYRKQFSYPPFLAHMEKTAERYEKWMSKRAPGYLASMRQWTRQMRAQARR
jgi:hypothetical protein